MAFVHEPESNEIRTDSAIHYLNQYGGFGEGGNMQLVRVSVSNYRRVQDFTVRVRKNAVLLGPNDSGKSSFLRALHLVVGVATPQLPGSVTARDFSERADRLSILGVAATPTVDTKPSNAAGASATNTVGRGPT